MLALAYAAAYPDRANPLVLIGCGTFDPATRRHFQALVNERMDAELRKRLARLADEVPDPDEQLRVRAQLALLVYSYDLFTTDLEIDKCDARGHHETWADMLRLQEEGAYPAAFAAIKAPVLMLHGSVDPHPGPLIRTSLERYLPHLEYREWDRCGHYPWLEKAVTAEFFAVLRAWLARQLREG